MPITPAVTLTFALVDTANNPIKGKVVLTLDNFTGIPRIPATNVIAKLVYTAFANSSGQGSVTFWGNYQTNQPNSFYQISVYPVDSQGNVSNAASSTNNYRFTQSGTFDLDSLTPINSNPQPVVVPQGQPVLLNPQGTQAIAVYGLEAPWFGSESPNLAQSGIFRMANSDSVAWRNAANSADLLLGVNGSNQLVFNGSVVEPLFQTNGVTNTVQNKLNLVQGANVTITSDSSGNTTITALSRQVELADFVTGPRTGKFWVKNASITSGSAVVNIGGNGLTYTFDNSDVGKNFLLDGPNNNPVMTGTILTVNSPTECTLSVTASYNAFGTNFYVWPSSQDDTVALVTGQSQLAGGKGKIHGAGDLYVFATAPTWGTTISPALTSFTGDGISATAFLFPNGTAGFTIGQGGIWYGRTQPANINPSPGTAFGGSPSEGFTVQGARSKPPKSITAVAIASNVVTFTCANDFAADDIIYVGGLTSTPGTQLRAQIYKVLTASGTQWTADTNPFPATPDVGTTSDNGLCVRFKCGIANLANGSDWFSVDNVEIHGFDGCGYIQSNNIVTTIGKLIAWNNYGDGIALIHGSAFDSGTATVFGTGWAKGNGMAGWYVNFPFYFTWMSPAADQNGINHFFQNCEQITICSPGSETPTISTINPTAYPGYGYVWDSCGGITVSSPYYFGQDFSTTRGDEITLAMSASQTGYVFRNNCNQFTFIQPNYENAVHFTPPTILWSIDNTCTDYTVIQPRYGTLSPSAYSDLGTSGLHIANGGFISPVATNARLTVNDELLIPPGASGNFVSGNIVICNAGLTVNGVSGGSGRLHCGLINPDQDTISITSGMLTLSGWGSGATIGFVFGTRPLFGFSVSAGTGASALPTVTMDISSFGFTFAPIATHSSRGTVGVTYADWTLVNSSNTTLEWQYNGTPSVGEPYGLTVDLKSQEVS